MATRVVRSRVGGYRWGGDRPSATARLSEIAVAAVLIVLAGAGVVVARNQPARTESVSVTGVAGGAPNAAPAQLTAAAADLLEQTTAKGGLGYRFEIVQRSTLVAKPDGPRIEIPDPADPRASLGVTDSAYQAGLVETGYVTPKGFAMEMRVGPATPDAPVDLAKGELLFRTLVTGGTTYRDDGRGWYPTDQPPGIGLDPATAALLPRLLRSVTATTDTTLAAGEGELGARDASAARAVSATGSVADIPGVIAVDGAPFTELTKPVGLTFDAAGRLVGLLVTARNTNVTAYDLVVVTEITLHYDDVPTGLPDPVPALAGGDRPQTIP